MMTDIHVASSNFHLYYILQETLNNDSRTPRLCPKATLIAFTIDD
jgi:hypothetical protein